MATQQPLPTSLDLNNIQGDILSGLPKKTETYYFFQINNVPTFRSQLLQFEKLVKSVAQTLKDREEIEKHRRHNPATGHKPHVIPMVGVNISFSQFGLVKMGISGEKFTDTAFKSGQLADSINLGDKGTSEGSEFVPDWEPAFKEQIHGLILIAGDSHNTVNKKIHEIEHIFGLDTAHPSIREVTRIEGDVRPGELSAHEHFGFLDGVSNPAIIGFNMNPPPAQPQSDLDREPWMVDGSFLVFRYLFQRVPEFDKFLGMTKREGSELLGARLVGRWKSGAPIDLAPFKDDKELAADPQRNNAFSFASERNFQKLCPFASHIRKTLPRADLEELGISIEDRRIMRRGIQFGPEVTRIEKRESRTHHGRGLLFACYQSSIRNGFQFIQQSWANNKTFPFGEETPQEPGFDAIIGQGPDRKLSGVDPNDPAKELALKEDWVVPRGGEYFFSPSKKALRDTFGLPPKL
ncbi:hypothetical protein BD779DRAFT_1612092 [Infundibulicybe gibba]|nr:hypothetical protein BD779DRAFT_1612092 [Infundibulicybe gibba]